MSRIGSGSYVMGYVLADQQGWLEDVDNGSQPFSDFVILNTFENLRKAVNSGAADFFMWEHFTSKRYYDNQEIKRVGEIYTPWSSWKIVASTAVVTGGPEVDGRLQDLFSKLDQGIAHFNAHPDEVVAYVSTALDYSEEDARAWLQTVRFPASTAGVSRQTIDGCIGVLQKAGVLVKGKGPSASGMITQER